MIKLKGNWKSLYLCEDYLVSDLGEIYSTKRDILMKQQTDTRGYKRVSLVVEGKQKGFLVHRLVAYCFCTKHKTKDKVNHINGTKDDNRAVNLEWCTNQENMNYAVATGLSKKFANRTKKVAQYNLKGKQLAVFPSVIEASEASGASRAVIAEAARGETIGNKAKGFIWRYL